MPPKVEYSLTEFGKTLIPVIAVLGQSGDEHEESLRNVILKREESSAALERSWGETIYADFTVK